MIFSVTIPAAMKLTIEMVCTRKRLFLPVNSGLCVVAFCCSGQFPFFVSRPHIMYSLSPFYDKYNEMLHYHNVDRRKYHLEDKVVTLPVRNPAFPYSHLN
ncbi:MAG: hypothetical protein LBG58_01095 [Planctomycetaceae bacterium]|jgi:hypothetical protein|nr:hypothetical protein [Planctomycetaceae bacterium]